MPNVNKINQIESTVGRVFSYMRWSSEPQAWGDSERRQQQQALDWCQRRGRALEQERFTDKGVSGWKGANRQSGALGALLKTATAGDTILIEDCDRWSRESPLDSLNALRDTVNRGVEIVFLKTGVTVTRGNFNDPAVLFPNFFSSFLANQENEKRAYRIRQAMEARRERVKAGNAVRGSMPCWLKWDATLGKPVVVEEKAEAVRKLFKLSLEGLGVMSILREMVGSKTTCPTKARNSKWNTRLIHRLLTDKGVIGHCNRVQPPVPGVYPAIISEADFYTCGEKLKSRRNFTAPIKYENNSIFTGLAKCSDCGSSLIKTRCGHNGKYYDYLCCSSGVLDRGAKQCKCRSSGVNYWKMEDAFAFALTHTVRIRELLAGHDCGPSRLDNLKEQLAAVQKQAEKLWRMIDGDDNPSKRLAEALKSAEAQEAELQAKVDAEAARRECQPIPVKSYEQLAALDLKDKTHRAKVRVLLRDIVDRISVELAEDKFTIHFKSGKSLPVSWSRAGIWTMLDSSINP